jgi:ABC-type proline/glycine betaine transport system permease subunit
MGYTGPVMNAIATENIVIGTLAGIGVVVLLVMFVYIVKRIMRKE